MFVCHLVQNAASVGVYSAPHPLGPWTTVNTTITDATVQAQQTNVLPYYTSSQSMGYLWQVHDER